MEAQKVKVLYHAGCFDGFCSAWIAHKKFGDKAEYIPVNYGENPPDVTGAVIYILDFSYKRFVMEQLQKQAFLLTVIDHHKTAQAELEGFGVLGDGTKTRCIFDMSKSGGRLTWEFFFSGNPTPWLVDYTEDRDLWRWTLPESRAMNAAIRSYPMDFDLWDRWDMKTSSWNYTPGILISEGKSILRAEKQIVDTHVRHAKEVTLDGHKVLVVNATVLQSEIAGELAKNRPFGVCWFERADGKRIVSLRSAPDGIDVSEIARKHGGGGHPHSAGYEE